MSSESKAEQQSYAMMLRQLSDGSPKVRASLGQPRLSIKKSPQVTDRMSKVVKDIIETYSPRGKEGTTSQGSNKSGSPRQKGAATTSKKK